MIRLEGQAALGAGRELPDIAGIGPVTDEDEGVLLANDADVAVSAFIEAAAVHRHSSRNRVPTAGYSARKPVSRRFDIAHSADRARPLRPQAVPDARLPTMLDNGHTLASASANVGICPLPRPV